jgi:hypothetical protein
MPDDNATIPLATNPTVPLEQLADEALDGVEQLQFEVRIQDSDGRQVLGLLGGGSRVELGHLAWGVYRFLEGTPDALEEVEQLHDLDVVTETEPSSEPE